MGQTKNVPLHTRTFVAITGNGVVIAEDMVRRLLLCNLNANMPDPEQRKFQPGFLERIYAIRSELLSACLTIWRWGRQNQLSSGVSLGSYETWCQWCRDPLLALGCADPMSRLAEIKAADPARRRLLDICDVWHEHHLSAWVLANDLHDDVKELIDEGAKRDLYGKLQYRRQFVQTWLRQHDGTNVGQYRLEKQTEDFRTRPVHRYRLAKSGLSLQDL
jgi:hypothetical protein